MWRKRDKRTKGEINKENKLSWFRRSKTIIPEDNHPRRRTERDRIIETKDQNEQEASRSLRTEYQNAITRLVYSLQAKNKRASQKRNQNM